MNYKFNGNYTEDRQVLFKKAQEKDLEEICRYLETDVNKIRIIKFEVFDTREGKQNADPNHSISRASARFKEMTIYRFWLPSDDPHFPHEITHLVAHTWSKPYLLETELDTWDNKNIKRTIEMVSTSFMQEGLAIAVDDIVFGRKLTEDGVSKLIDQWCQDQLDQMPKSLTEVINLDGFGSLPNKIVVPFAASFSKFLLQRFGVQIYKDMYVQIKETQSAEDNVVVLEKNYSELEEKLLGDWKSSI